MNNRIWALGLAGSMLMSGASFAEKLQTVPQGKNISISKYVKKTDVKVEEDFLPVALLYKAEISFPKFSGLSDKMFEEELNYIIKVTAEKDFAEFQDKVDKMEKAPFENGELKISYEVKSKGDIISVAVNKTANYASDANEDTRTDYYNIDTVNNKQLNLKDLFKKDADFESVINEEILKEINGNKDKYFQEEGKFTGIKAEQQFYVNKDGNIVITFDKYEIAPGSTGPVEIVVDNSSLKDLRLDPKDGERPMVAGKVTTDDSTGSIRVRVPVIEGLSDAKFQSELNKEIEKLAERSIKEYKEKDKQVEDAKNMSSEMEIGYEVKHDGEILSVLISDFRYIKGNANPQYSETIYNIDTVNNKRIELKDFFKGNADYKKEVDGIINKEIATNKDDYFQDENKFKGIKDDQKFYVNKAGDVVVVFDKYEIAPGSTGTPEFVIKKSNVKTAGKDATKTDAIKVLDTVKLNGIEYKLKDKMFKNKRGTVMVPVAELAKEMGFEVSWNDKNEIITLLKGPVQVTASLKENQYSFSRAFVILDEGAILKDGKTYVPAEFFYEVLQNDTSIGEDGVLNIKY